MTVVDEHAIIRVAGWRKYPWLVHGFSTRSTGDFLDWPSDEVITQAFGGGNATATLRQIHSGRVVRADSGWGNERPEADAVVTAQAGVLTGVLENSLDQLSEHFGSRSADLEAATGPAIGSCCFEVGPEVASQFPTEFVSAKKPRPHIDLSEYVRALLIDRGVSNVTRVAECTMCHPDRYYSYRGQGAATGRMISVVGVR